jgi:hypothetical protein
MAAFGRLSAIVLLVFFLGFATIAWAGASVLGLLYRAHRRSS